MRLSLVLLAIVCAVYPLPALAQASDTDAQAIRQVVEEAYVRGVFINRDPAAVRAGFHPDFVMSVLDEGQIIVVSLDMWLERLGLDGQPSSETVTHTFERVDITGGTAVAKLQLWIDDEHEYTDYLGLYQFARRLEDRQQGVSIPHLIMG